MKSAISVILSLALLIYAGRTLAGSVDLPADKVLRTASGVAMFSLSRNPSGEFAMRTSEEISETGLPMHGSWFTVMSPLLANLGMCSLLALYLLIYIRIGIRERYLLLVVGSLTLYSVAYVDHLGSSVLPDAIWFAGVLSAILFPAFVWSCSRSVGSGRRQTIIVLIAILAAITAVSVLPGIPDPVLRYQVLFSINGTGLLFSWLILLSNRKIPFQRWKTIGLVLCTTYTLPVIQLLIPFLVKVPLSFLWNSGFFTPVLFPVAFILYTSRRSMLQFQLPVPAMLPVIAIYIFFFSAFWFLVIYPFFDIQSAELSWYDALLPALLFLLMEPARYLLIFSANKRFRLRSERLFRHLAVALSESSDPRKIETFTERMLRRLEDEFSAQVVRIVFDRRLFANWQMKSDRVVFLPSNHRIWSSIRVWQRTSPDPVLNRSNFGFVREYLEDEDAVLLIPARRYRAYFLLSGRKNGDPYHSGEIDFLRKLMRDFEPLMENYRYLVETVQLRRQERILQGSARIQRKLIPTYQRFPELEFASIYAGYSGVTGDYLDFIPFGNGEYIVALGDVTGHGLGSAYVMSVVRAIMRASVVRTDGVRGIYDLSDAVGRINHFLLHEYSGSEYMTLFAAHITISGNRVTMNYVNAGQHPGQLYLNELDRFVTLTDHQRLLGVSGQRYAGKSITIQGQARLILYSDGAFEAFDRTGRMLGESKLTGYIRSTRELDIRTQLQEVRNRVMEHTGDAMPNDDLSLIAVQITGSDQPSLL